jgi:nitrate reductase NapE component
MSRTLLARAQGVKQSLWLLVVAPTVWALHFLSCYVYAAVRCAKGGRDGVIDDVRIAIAVATVLALAVVAACGYVAWAHSVIPGDPPPHQESTLEDRMRFLAVAALLLAVLSFVAIVFTALPAFVFEDCR